MTSEEWEKLSDTEVVMNSIASYKLLFKDSLGRWITEATDIHTNLTKGFRRLQPKEKDMQSYHIVR